CYEEDADKLYVCEPTSGDCDTAAEWRDTSGAGGGTSAVIGFSGAGAIIPKATTLFLGLGPGTVGTTEINFGFYVTQAGTLSDLYTYISANASDQAANTVFVRKNGVATSITTSYGAGETGLKSDTTNTETVAATDYVTVQVVNNDSGGGGAADIVIEAVSFLLGP
ncbi:hypothetical protein LCGC14_3042300, partial [marine sediment metagenome]